jgi:hypothetical protein
MSKNTIRQIKYLLSITAFIAVVLFNIPARSSELSSAGMFISGIDTVKASTDTTKVSADSLKSGADTTLSKKEIRYQTRKREREVRDSIKAVNDSIRWSKPRIMDTYIVPDSLQGKRIITWTHDNYLNNISFRNPDTTFNENFYDYPFYKKDPGVTYLGISGSPTVSHNYFSKEKLRDFEMYEPWLVYSNTPDNLPFYNTKTPYTELAYWGTLFANRDKEETNIKFMHTQNLSPELNINVSYKRFGSKGLLNRESTDNRTFAVSSNYLGRRYVMHAGYIFQGVKREENGGVADEKMVLDTTYDDPKELSIILSQADNRLKRNTLFLTHSYGIPVRLSKKDTLNYGEGTTTYFGHSFEYSTYFKKYTDEISESDSLARALYNNMFLISPTTTFDSSRVSVLENKAFIRIQPWAKDAIVSKLDGGIGHKVLSIYSFRPEFYSSGAKNSVYNNVYIYFGAAGNFRKYFRWDAIAKYDLTGYYANNFSLDAKAGVSLYPVEGGVHINARMQIENRRPGWFSNQYYSNHYAWNNNFDNITETRFEGHLDIPRFKLSAFAGYAIINNPVYHGIQGIAAQHNDVINILSAYLKKDFKLGFLHLDNRVLFQMTSNSEVIPLPLLSANLRYYMQFELVKNVLTAQIGADATFNTRYYAPAYSPALGIFHNQNNREIGNYPYIDAFVNLQWKRTAIFVKYINATQGWPDSGYFSAYRYIRPVSAIKFGIYWPFYVK